MALNVATVMTELQTALDTIDGLRVSDTIPDSVNPPIAVCGFGGITYNRTFDGSVDLEVEVTVIVGRQSSRTGQTDLYGYLSTGTATSIKDAIETGSYTQNVDVRVDGAPAVVDVELAGTNYLGVQFPVMVIN